MPEDFKTPELTFGEKAVGITFNPGNSDAVHQTKKRFADLIDEQHNLRNVTESPEQKRLCSIAITELQTAQMWAIKAMTWRD